MSKGEIACYKQLFLFSQCFPRLYIFGASKWGIVWSWVKMGRKHCGKRRKLRAISSFPTVFFLKDLYCRHLKTWAF